MSALVAPSSRLSRARHLRSARRTGRSGPLPGAVATAAAAATEVGVSLVVHIADGDVTRIAVLIPRVGNDVVSTLCGSVGVEYKTEVRQLQGMMGAEQIHRLEYQQHKGATSGLVDVHLVPGIMARGPNLSRN